MVVSWRDMMVSWHEMIVSCHDTIVFYPYILFFIICVSPPTLFGRASKKTLSE